MLAANYYKVPITVTLSVVASVILISIVASMAFPAKSEG
jgi:hypothetical protein